MTTRKMKRLLSTCVALASLTFASAYALTISDQPPASPPAVPSPPVAWASHNAGDNVTIANGTGANLNIIINVNNDASTDPAGVDLKNCGSTTHIDAGSSAVCITSDPKNPVSFHSGKDHTATGTYQITQQLPNK